MHAPPRTHAGAGAYPPHPLDTGAPVPLVLRAPVPLPALRSPLCYALRSPLCYALRSPLCIRPSSPARRAPWALGGFLGACGGRPRRGALPPSRRFPLPALAPAGLCALSLRSPPLPPCALCPSVASRPRARLSPAPPAGSLGRALPARPSPTSRGAFGLVAFGRLLPFSPRGSPSLPRPIGGASVRCVPLLLALRGARRGASRPNPRQGAKPPPAPPHIGGMLPPNPLPHALPWHAVGDCPAQSPQTPWRQGASPLHPHGTQSGIVPPNPRKPLGGRGQAPCTPMARSRGLPRPIPANPLAAGGLPPAPPYYRTP